MGGKTTISIMVAQEAPKKTKEEYCRPPLKEKVKEYIRRIESNIIESDREWYYIKRLYERLCRTENLNPEHEDILRSIEDILEKFGNHDHDSAVDMDAQYINRYDDEEI